MSRYIQRLFCLFILFLSAISMVWAQEDDPYADCPYGSQPELTLITEANAIVCSLPGEISFQLKGYENEFNNKAHYYISFGDGSEKGVVSYQSSAVDDEIIYSDFPYSVDYTNEQLAEIKGQITHQYTTSYCDLHVGGSWKINILVIGCDPQFTQMTYTTLKLQKAGTVGFNSYNLCDYTVEFTNFSGGFVNSMCKEVELYKWEFGDGEELSQLDKSDTYKPEKTISHKYKCPGIYNVTLYGYSSIQSSGGKIVGSSCGSDNAIGPVVVLPAPELTQKKNITVCTGEDIEEVILQDLDVCTYDWYNSDTKKCEKKNVCEVIGEKVAYSFDYRITGDDIGLELGTFYKEEEEAIIPAFKAINNTNVTKKVKVCITPYNAYGCAGKEMCYEIIVHPSAEITNLKDYAFCKNTQAKVDAFQSSVSNVTFNWKVKEGDWRNIGLPAESGEGNIPEFTAKNDTNTPKTVKIEVQANSSLCQGSVGDFDITVYPIPEFEVSSQSPTTCNGTEGWIEFKNLNINVTNYRVTFKKDGELIDKDYPVSNGIVKVTGLTKGAYTEIKIAASGSECYVSTEDITLVDPPLPNVPVISSNSPVCTEDNLILKVDNSDADIQAWKWTGPLCDGVAYSSNSKDPAPKPMQYCMAGDYTLEVERDKCYASATIKVDYREDPEVTLSPFESVCVGYSFLVDDEVTFNWKTIPESQHKIKWEVIDEDGNVVTSQNDIEHPQFIINKIGNYKVKVTIEGFGCNGTKLEAEQPLKVKEENYDLDVVAKNLQICANENVVFENNTTKEAEVKYNWTITPETGVYFRNETTNTSDAPEILFQEPGKYVVQVEADNGCTKKTQKFDINVRKNPTVTLNELPYGCSGETFLDINQYVEYTWNNVEGETPVWSVTPADGVEISDPNSNYPIFKYTKAGDYVIRVDMPDISCGIKNYKESALKVYEGSITVDIKPSETVICEAMEIEFENKTVSTDPIEYEWKVSPMEGVVISDVKHATPTIRFNKYGEYVVSVLIDGVCQDLSETFNIRVKKDPEITFNPIETICNNNKFTFDDTKINYEWYNMLDSEKEIEWTVTPNTGVIEENVDTEHPSYTFSSVGDYKITVKVKAMGCPNEYIEESINLNVISDNLELKVETTELEGCIPLDVTFTNTTSDTDEISYNWNVDKSEENWEFKSGTESAKSPIITFNKDNSYKVTLEAKNKCSTKYLYFDVKAYEEVHFELDVLPIVCGEYIFDAQSETQGLHVTGNQNNIKSIKWLVYKSTDNTNSNYQEASTESYEFTSGDINTLFPIIKIKESGFYKIELQAQTICNDETVSTTIEIEEPIIITLTQPEPLCANIADEYGQNPYTLVAIPADGKWSWVDDVPVEQSEYLDSNNNKFYPNKPGTYKLKYGVQSQACYAEKSMDVVVKEYPTMDIGEDIYVCEKDQTPVLLGGTPNDGVWSGNEVSRNGDEYYFNPPLAVGDYEIIYTITDASGCKNRDYKEGHIQALPSPDFGPDSHCLPGEVIFQPVADVATNQFKFSYGDGTEGEDFNHLYETIGEYEVKLIVTALSGCVDSLTKKILIDKYPDQKILMSEKMACSPFTPEIKLEYEYLDDDTEFLWDFGLFGKQYTEQPTPVSFTATERDTTYQFSVTVKNNCGEYTVTDTVRVLATPLAKIIPSIERGCSPVVVNFKNATKGSVQGMKYTWDFGDGSPLEYDLRASHTFETGYKNDSTYKVMLIAENHCGADTTYQEIYVIPPVVYPQIVNPTPKVCVGDSVCILNETMEVIPHDAIITYKWNFGNGKISDNPNDVCAVYETPGNYKIELNITTSCGSSESDYAYVEVLEGPEFAIAGPDYICNYDTVKPVISLFSNIREVSWDFGNGEIINNTNPTYQYKESGEYVITATVTEDNFASCKASKSIPILVRALPNPDIEPLEVDTCSPYVYAPKLSEEVYFGIDYENNGIVDSNNEHTYINTGLEPIIYQTTIYLEDKYGCKSIKKGVMNIYPEPIAGISIVNVEEERPEEVTFSSTSYGADACKWTLPFLGTLTTCQDVTEYFYENKTETIYLEVSNMYNCIAKDSIDYTPMMKGLYFPNTFVPNGITEEVRTFKGVGLGLKTYRLEVYDLYGNLVFYTTSLDENGSPNEGWDGRDQAGNMMPQDVYTWKAEAVFLDGSVYTFGNDYNNIPGTEVNDVTLHRGSVLLLHR